jgi:hypothetical protein
MSKLVLKIHKVLMEFFNDSGFSWAKNWDDKNFY